MLSLLLVVQAMTPGLKLGAELARMPALVTHYQQHAQQDGLSFASFLRLHYGRNATAEQQAHPDQEHSQLPFCGQHQFVSGPTFVAPSPCQLYAMPISFFVQPKFCGYRFSVITQYLASPFQPPRA